MSIWTRRLPVTVHAASGWARCWPLHPSPAFTLDRGADAQTEYLFNKHRIHHLFCKTCGIESFAKATAPDGTPTMAINVNCLEGVEPRELKSQHFDGRSK